MRVEILRGADNFDQFNQSVQIVAEEEIGGKTFRVGVSISDSIGMISGKQSGAYATELLQMTAKRLSLSFARNLERSILEEMGKITGVEVPILGRIQTKQKKVKPLLPKDILSELEPMEEKRIMENLGVAV